MSDIDIRSCRCVLCCSARASVKQYRAWPEPSRRNRYTLRGRLKRAWRRLCAWGVL